MKEPQEITPEMVEAHGLTTEEMQKIREILGREPNFTELGIFSVMWSEHCSYKSSRSLLKFFPTRGRAVLIEAGQENAGVVDIGEGMAVVFKMESHNHPSAIEPYQGAATGVGGIIRDIFTMGARPMALMDSLRFGSLKKARSQWLLKGVVGGIAFYGNCLGIPTVGGELFFDETYQGNPLVNVFCLGLIKKDGLVRARARGVGNPVFYVGSATGRDGLGGASFASRELTEISHEDRPAVQIGDPFMEKLLLEATLELIKTGVVVGMQDMGAAGITSSVAETASRAGTGIEINLDLVPRREEGMIPYEVMLSESQERMLVIIKEGREGTARRIFQKWDLHAVRIGQVTSDGLFRVLERGRKVAEIPAQALTEKAPVYHRRKIKPDYLKEARSLDISSIPEPADYNEVLLNLLSSCNITRKNWVYEQYDYMVRTNTVLLPGADAALLRIKGTRKALALTCDGNGRYCFLDPYLGGMIAVAEAARNLVCTGAKPLALTNCLNFGTPTDPEVFWQFFQCVKGMSRACRFLRTPVTGGNVSFYNENPQSAVDPTPVVGMVGILEDIDLRCTPWFKEDGDLIVLLGRGKESLGGSEYLQMIHGLKKGTPPPLDLKEEKLVHQICLDIIGQGLIKSAHDTSDGGLAIAVTECCILNQERLRGVQMDLSPLNLEESLRCDLLLFGESQSRLVISCSPEKFSRIKEMAQEKRVSCLKLGQVGGSQFTVQSQGVTLIDLPVDALSSAWRKGLHHHLA